MKKAVKFALCLVAMFIAFNAQAEIKKSDVLGVWTLTVNQNGMNMISTYDFKDDNTVTQFVMANSASPKINIMADVMCTYEIKDDAIIFKVKPESLNFSMFEIEGLPAEYIPVAKQQLINELVGSEQKLTNVVIDGNTMTAKSQNEEVTLSRK